MTHFEFYHNEIHKGNIVVGNELHRELDNLSDDLNNSKYVYDTRDADRRIDFIQNCIRLTKSPFYGKPMILLPWQKAFIEVLYSFKMSNESFIDPTGIERLNDRFKKVLLLIARKCAKSETCSALGDTELVIGNEGADIVCSSNDDAQASILYDACDLMREMIDPNSKDTKRGTRFIKNKITNSKIFKMSDKTHNKEGRNIDFAVIDEVHEMKTNVILKSIEQSMSLKDNPKLIMITTEGFVNDGVLDKLLIDARKILNGEDDSISAERFLPWLYTQDSEQEIWIDENSWFKSNPSLDVIKKRSYLREQIDLAKKSKTDRVFVLSKDFNFKQNNASAWLNVEDYKYSSEHFNLEDFDGAIILGAVDLAETTDLVSAKCLLMKQGSNTKYIFQHYWICENKLKKTPDKNEGAEYIEWAKQGLLTIVKGNEVDTSIVADWYYELYKKYHLRLMSCGYDQKFALEFTKRMKQYGFKCEMILQSKEVLNNATRLLESDLQNQVINYNKNLIDAWCLGNSAIEFDSKGMYCQIVKITGMHGKKIDGAVTMVMIEEMYRRFKSEFMKGLK